MLFTSLFMRKMLILLFLIYFPFLLLFIDFLKEMMISFSEILFHPIPISLPAMHSLVAYNTS